jgi:hypothetical protein
MIKSFQSIMKMNRWIAMLNKRNKKRNLVKIFSFLPLKFIDLHDVSNNLCPIWQELLYLIVFRVKQSTVP